MENYDKMWKKLPQKVIFMTFFRTNVYITLNLDQAKILESPLSEKDESKLTVTSKYTSLLK